MGLNKYAKIHFSLFRRIFSKIVMLAKKIKISDTKCKLS